MVFKSAWNDVVEDVAAKRKIEVRGHATGRLPLTLGIALDRLGFRDQCLGEEVAQRRHAGDDRRQGAGQVLFGGIGVVQLATGCVLVDLGMEGCLDCANRAGETDHGLGGRHRFDREALRRQPLLDRFHVLVIGPEHLTKLAWRQPLVVVRRRRIVQRAQIALKLLLLIGAALEDQRHRRNDFRLAHGTLIRAD